MVIDDAAINEAYILLSVRFGPPRTTLIKNGALSGSSSEDTRIPVNIAVRRIRATQAV